MSNILEIKSALRDKISAAIIVRDGSKTIERTIKSIKEIAGQIVVVDTGSIDSTPTICSRLGADVYYFKWDDDFSSARNYSLQFVLNDWIIIIDADEELDMQTLIDNSELFNNDNLGGIKVTIKNLMGDTSDSGITEHVYTRIFRNSKGFQFNGRIHEQISTSISNNGFEIAESYITIKHYGYADNSAEKSRRNRVMLEMELEHNPYDPWLKYHLAETYFSEKDFAKSKNIYADIMDSPMLSDDQQYSVRLRLGQIALSEDNYSEVENILDFSTYNAHIDGMRKFLLGSSLMVQSRFHDAEILLSKNEVVCSNMVDKKILNQCFDVLKKVKNV